MTRYRFQSTHSYRVRRLVGIDTAQAKLFQSTHSYRVRQKGVNNMEMTIHFNPRTHIECDGMCSSTQSINDYFNPRTHIECDMSGITKYNGGAWISIHALI